MPRDPKVTATMRLTAARANDEKARAAVRATRLAVRKAAAAATKAGLSHTDIGRSLGITRQSVRSMLKEGE